jgi:hypothetical protein
MQELYSIDPNPRIHTCTAHLRAADPVMQLNSLKENLIPVTLNEFFRHAHKQLFVN